MKKETFNIIIKCDSDEDREEVLNVINEGLAPLDTQTLYQRKIVRYGKESNVYFSENDEKFHHDKPRSLN
tara:strand:+ start:41 stop:250 length:210 start_codon:yes stop_codon:yes gene_type:complete